MRNYGRSMIDCCLERHLMINWEDHINNGLQGVLRG